MNHYKRSTERKQEPNAYPVLKVGRRATTDEELDAAQTLQKYAVGMLRETAYKLRKSSQYLKQMAENIEQVLLEIG
jgi:hypothetical protein